MHNKSDAKRSASISTEQKAAMKFVDGIRDKILKEYPDVLAALLQRRIRRQTYETIAAEERGVLEQLQATTEAVRIAVVCKVCVATLHPDLQKDIERETRARHAREQNNFTLDSRRKSAKKKQICEWSDEMDAKLLELMSTMVHGDDSGRLHGCSDWERISQAMKDQFDLQLLREQWMNRGHNLLTRKRMRSRNPGEARMA